MKNLLVLGAGTAGTPPAPPAQRSGSGFEHLVASLGRVSGRVGEWITIGGVDESASSEQRGTLRRYSTDGGQNLSMRLKVDVLE